MALAWKAGWVHALTSSNLVSSATSIPALTRAGIVFPGDKPTSCPVPCPECAPKISQPHQRGRALRTFWTTGEAEQRAKSPAHREGCAGRGLRSAAYPVRRRFPEVRRGVAGGDGAEQLVEVLDADPDEPHAEA